jgi:hypothetical protein
VNKRKEKKGQDRAEISSLFYSFYKLKAHEGKITLFSNGFHADNGRNNGNGLYSRERVGGGGSESSPFSVSLSPFLSFHPTVI